MDAKKAAVVVAAEEAAKEAQAKLSQSAVAPAEKTAEMKQLVAVREAMDAGPKSGPSQSGPLQSGSGSPMQSAADDHLDQDSVEDSRMLVGFSVWTEGSADQCHPQPGHHAIATQCKGLGHTDIAQGRPVER